MWSSNPTWGSKSIQAEMPKLGIEVSDSTVRKYRPKHRPSTIAQSWKTFLHNHAKDIIVVDFFAVPTATFRVLYVLLVLAHERRKVLHFNITDSPSASWSAQQLTEAFPYSSPPRYLSRDRDGIYGLEFVRRAIGLGLEQKLIVTRSPWQNPFVERLIGSIRRECLDHLIVLNACHLRRVLADYFDLLSSPSHASIAGAGLSPTAPHRTTGAGKGHPAASGRRPAPSLHTSSCLKWPSSIYSFLKAFSLLGLLRSPKLSQ